MVAAGAHVDPANPRDHFYYVRWNVEADQPTAACKRVTVSWSMVSSKPMILA